jgi:hypothetical protein
MEMASMRMGISGFRCPLIAARPQRRNTTLGVRAAQRRHAGGSDRAAFFDQRACIAAKYKY